VWSIFIDGFLRLPSDQRDPPIGGAQRRRMQALVACDLKELHRKRGDGSRALDSLFAELAAAGLVSGPARDLKSKFFSVCDAALNGLPSWILDYLAEVCSDPHL
jgi:hypothetical protein